MPAFSMFHSAVALGAFLLAFSASPAFATSRATVDAVATAIEEHYFDEGVAARVAADLRARRDAGDFDDSTAPATLAEQLTQQLEPVDAHFSVQWRSPAAVGASDPSDSADSERDINYGIRRVDLLPGRVGFIDLRFFAGFDPERPAEPARQAIDAALQLVAAADAVIIDLRRTPGGSPAMVGYLASAFLAPGRDVFNTFHGRGGRTLSEAPIAWHTAPRTDVPLYVLVSGRTASAAESFAYTLQQAQRATLVGETTYGAANPGDTLGVGDGFSVFVSVATPINPLTGTNWEHRGVAPDVTASADDAADTAYRLALQALLARAPNNADARAALAALHPFEAGTLDAFTGAYDPLRIDIEDGALAVRRDRRMPVRLLPVAADTFADLDNPTHRYRFERDATGRVIAVESANANNATRYARSED